MFDQARSLELAIRNSESYASPPLSVNAAVPLTATEDQEQIDSGTLAAVGSDASTCFFCGNSNHPRSRCPARDAVVSKCQKKGHFAKVCPSKKISKNKVSAAAWSPTLATVGAPESLSKSLGTVTVEGLEVKALFDSASTESFIHPRLVERVALTIHPSSGTVSMATSVSSTVSITGTCTTTLIYQGREYAGYRLSILPGLCADLILGLDFQSQHSSVTFHYGGSEPPLAICGFSTLNIDPPERFANLAVNCHPIASKSRRYSREDSAFIDEEMKRLLKEGIIEPSLSPWRAQVVVTKDENHRKRLAIDYSQTINRFTLLDAFPLPRITDMVNKIAQYRVFSTIDLRSAYHQVPLKEEDKPYRAFEARGNLYQFTRLPFGVTNGVACFQREMMKFVDENGLEASFPYLDNVTICGKDQEDHDANLKHFLEAAKHKNLCYNTEKCSFSTRCLPIFGYIIEEGTIRPDPNRLRPLRELPIAHDPRSMSRCLGLFSYYSQWIPKFSDRIKPIASCKTFPLPPPAVEAFESLKKTIEDAVVTAIDETIPFEVETDASEVALAATLNQNGKPVAFFSRTLQGSELKHASIEKEAQAIIEAVRHWRHFLAGRHFILKTDQKSASYMFDKQHRGKIKNEKFLRWRLKLSCFSFDIVYWPGRDNVPADTLSRAMCAMATEDSLFKLHEALCHPGITRLNHFVRTKNLPYSLEEIKKMTSRCRVCCECRPQFHHPEKVPLIKATQPFERINIDFKGPLPTYNGNKYFLMVVDDYSRFPFVFPCPDVSTNTVIKCLTSLFSLVGMPAYVHSDRGASFMSRELREFLTSKGVASSRTTSYNPEGNGQAERCHGVIWKAVTMSLKSKNLPLRNWQDVLPDVLHSVRSLLCTATNETPHERFFGFSRRSSAGASVPTWLATPGPLYMKRQVRTSKMDPRVEEVELLQANPHYAHVRYPDGRETTVATKHLAPKGQVVETQPAPECIPMEAENLPVDTSVGVSLDAEPSSVPEPPPEPQPELTPARNVEPAPVRRSQRIRRPVVRLNL